MGKYAVYLVLAFTFSMLAYTNGLRKNQYRSELVMVNNHNTFQAKNIAYTVGEAALRRINQDNDYAEELIGLGKSKTIPFKKWVDIGGEYQVYLVSDDNEYYTLKATGKIGSDVYTAEAKLHLISSDEIEEDNWEPDLPWGLFSDEKIELSGSAKIYGSAATNTDKNKGVKLTSATKITGSLLIGKGANIEKTVSEGNKKKGNVEGSIEVLSEKIIYDLPEFPEYPSDSKKIKELKIDWKKSGETLNPNTYEGYYFEKIKIESNSVLNINIGDEDRILYVGKFEIKQGKVNVIGSGKLTIFVDDKFTMGGSSSFNKDGNQSQVFMYYGAKDKVKLSGSTKFNGSIYAKNAKIKLAGSGGIQGHIISGGDKIDITGNAKAHSRMVYAPNADVKVSGSGSITGSVVAKSFKASGNGSIVFADKYDSDIKDAKLKESSEDSYDEDDKKSKKDKDDDKKSKKDKDDDDDDDDEDDNADDNNDKDKDNTASNLTFELLYWN